ncbi:MAG TPA: endonuclease/exonuclease/phosphatase family protein [Chloroflexota bacterium]|nr:endonuclease/exonuclease/phosphatase family protein [Chloroflexota bacterium]HUM69893.1 endonuclease/exonuclease/phosphatase family protein [Chloroflexota bacterium]
MKLDGKLRAKYLVGLFGVGIVVAVFLIHIFYTAKNYEDPDSPRFSGNFATTPPAKTNQITVVSYNIRYAQEIEQAITELAELDIAKGVDIILLQEMDETGTAQIAQALQMNFVYFPAAIEPRYDQNFGTAVLAKWPILESTKLILPHKSFSSRLNRSATKATIAVNDLSILVYSVHTETIFTLPAYRRNQFTAVLEDSSPDAEYVIVGGDFNTATKADVAQLERIFGDGRFVRASAESGFTLIKYGLEVEADHIFSKGLLPQSAGKIPDATASDHLPIWVTLSLP